MKYTLQVNNDKLKKKAFMITFANAAQFGNNAYVAPTAKISDGLMDICILAPFPIIKAIGISMRLFRKSINRSEYMNVLRTNEVLVKTKKKWLIHYDGEPYITTSKKLKIKMVSGGLKVLVPDWFNE